MKRTLASAVLIAALVAGGASAATFAGYTPGAPLYLGDATVFSDVGGFGTIDSNFPDTLASITFNLDPLLGPSGTLSINDGSDPPLETASSFTLVDYVITETGDPSDDEIAFLFDLDTGPFAIATFVGDLDGFGLGDFFEFGAFASGSLTVVQATRDAAVIPLPAGGILILTGLAALATARRLGQRRR